MSPDPVGPGADAATPTEAIHRGLRVLALVTWAAVVGVCAPRLWLCLGFGPWSDAGVVLLAAHHVVVLAGLLCWHRSRSLALLAGLLLVLGWLALLPQWRHLPLGTLWAPGYIGFSWAVWASMAMPRSRSAVAIWSVFAGLGLVDLLLVLSRDGSPPGAAVLVSLWFLTPVSPLLFFTDALQRVAARLEWQIAQRESAAREREQHQAEASARAEAARLLHDHVLHALHAVAHVGDGGVTPAMAQRECRVALRELDRPGRTEPVSTVGSLLRAAQVVQDMGIEVRGDTGPLPADVAQSMAAAASAALVNARKHARTQKVRVDLHHRGGVHEVAVRDEGVGFRPERIPPSRLGVRRSIRERMEDVGGQADVASSPGHGTQVTLSWPQVPVKGPDPAWSDGTRRVLRRLLVRTAWPGMVAALVAMPILGPTTGGWPVVLVVGAALLVGVWGSRQLVEGASLVRKALVLLGVSVACWYLALGLGPDTADIITQHHLWPLWACVALLHLAILCLPPRQGLAALGGWMALMLVGLVTFHPRLDWPRIYSLWLIPLADGLLAVSALVVFQRLVSRQFTERELTERSRRAVARVRQATHLQEYWSAQVAGEAMPLMAEVASGDGLVSREQVDHALLLEATLRDELILGPDQPEILEVLNDLRRRGWHINTPSVTPEERVFLAGMAFWTAKIGDPAYFKQEVQVTMSRGQAVLVVRDPSPEQVALWQRTAATMGAELDHTEHYARLRMTLPQVPGSTFDE